MPNSKHDSPIVIFDGECGLCSGLVAFILKYDRTGELFFSPNSSPFAKNLLARSGLTHESTRTIVVVHGEQVLLRSDAVVFLARHVNPPLAYLRYLGIIPKFIRDLGYRLVAACRRVLPGYRDPCSLLSPDQQRRIIVKSPVE